MKPILRTRTSPNQINHYSARIIGEKPYSKQEMTVDL